jgi:hypothetical protein
LGNEKRIHLALGEKIIAQNNSSPKKIYRKKQARRKVDFGTKKFAFRNFEYLKANVSNLTVNLINRIRNKITILNKYIYCNFANQ